MQRAETAPSSDTKDVKQDRKPDPGAIKSDGKSSGHQFLKKLFTHSRDTKTETVYGRNSEFTKKSDYGTYLYRAFSETQFAAFLENGGKFPETRSFGGLTGNPRYSSGLIGNKVKDQNELYRYLVEFYIEDDAVVKEIRDELSKGKPEGYHGEKKGLEKWEKALYPKSLSNMSIGLGATGAGGIDVKTFNGWIEEGQVWWMVIKMQLPR
ncbi:hypothetical protein [Sorangium sp. So ce590]|uniref:hypothetical protein n=1 Tax=unclassified Sorangium TaxID=2621164 RepID=UPI003F5DCB6C